MLKKYTLIKIKQNTKKKSLNIVKIYKLKILKTIK